MTDRDVESGMPWGSASLEQSEGDRQRAERSQRALTRQANQARIDQAVADLVACDSVSSGSGGKGAKGSVGYASSRHSKGSAKGSAAQWRNENDQPFQQWSGLGVLQQQQGAMAAEGGQSGWGQAGVPGKSESARAQQPGESAPMPQSKGSAGSVLRTRSAGSLKGAGGVGGGFAAVAGSIYKFGQGLMGAARSRQDETLLQAPRVREEQCDLPRSTSAPFGTPLSQFQMGADQPRAEAPRRLPAWRLSQGPQYELITPVKTKVWKIWRDLVVAMVDSEMIALPSKNMMTDLLLGAGEAVLDDKVGDASGFEVPWGDAAMGQMTSPLIQGIVEAFENAVVEAMGTHHRAFAKQVGRLLTEQLDVAVMSGGSTSSESKVGGHEAPRSSRGGWAGFVNPGVASGAGTKPPKHSNPPSRQGEGGGDAMGVLARTIADAIVQAGQGSGQGRAVKDRRIAVQGSVGDFPAGKGAVEVAKYERKLREWFGANFALCKSEYGMEAMASQIVLSCQKPQAKAYLKRVLSELSAGVKGSAVELAKAFIQANQVSDLEAGSMMDSAEAVEQSCKVGQGLASRVPVTLVMVFLGKVKRDWGKPTPEERVSVVAALKQGQRTILDGPVLTQESAGAFAERLLAALEALRIIGEDRDDEWATRYDIVSMFLDGLTRAT